MLRSRAWARCSLVQAPALLKGKSSEHLAAEAGALRSGEVSNGCGPRGPARGCRISLVFRDTGPASQNTHRARGGNPK
eukprot:6931599-Prymnesium_polylepis.2